MLVITAIFKADPAAGGAGAGDGCEQVGYCIPGVRVHWLNKAVGC